MGASVSSLEARCGHLVAHHLTVSLSDLNLNALARDSDHDAGDPPNNAVAARCSDPDDLLARLPHAHGVHSPLTPTLRTAWG